MNNNTEEILKTINMENLIWVIYLFIIGLSFYANYFEKEYYTKHDIKAKENYRKLNIFIFSIAICIYYYFFKDNLKAVQNLTCADSSKKRFLNEANLVAATLVLIAGIILLYIAITDTQLETEIAFS